MYHYNFENRIFQYKAFYELEKVGLWKTIWCKCYSISIKINPCIMIKIIEAAK